MAGILVLLSGVAVYAFCPDENVGMIIGVILLHTIGTVLLFRARLLEGVVKYWFSSAYVSVLHMPFDLLYIVLGEMVDVNLPDDIRNLYLLYWLSC